MNGNLAYFFWLISSRDDVVINLSVNLLHERERKEDNNEHLFKGSSWQQLEDDVVL